MKLGGKADNSVTDKQQGAIVKMSNFLCIPVDIPDTKQEASELIDSLIKRVTSDIRYNKMSNIPDDSMFWESHETVRDMWEGPF